MDGYVAVARPWAVDRSVVGRHHAQLDQEADRQAPAVDQAQHALERLGGVLARDAVLHLREADQADVRVDAIARVDVLGAAHQRGDRPVQPRDHAREAAPETAGETERGVLEEDVLDEGLRLAGRLGSRSVRAEVSVSARRV